MMITSNNLVQLLSGLFVVDIMALLIIKDVEKSKYYATFNLIADMMLFTVLAVVNCQLESLDLRQIIEFGTQIVSFKTGKHNVAIRFRDDTFSRL